MFAALPLANAAAAPEPPADAATPAQPTREQRIEWWREARFGMFVHWGLYAIPGGVWKDKVYSTGYSEWLMYSEKIPAKEYSQLATQFNPTQFDATAWAALAKKAGMKYLVLTTKHHDGFSMFKSALTPYNVVDATPFKRDVTRELVNACHTAGLRFGCYYSIDRDWYRAQGPGNRYKQSNVWDFPDSKREDFDHYVSSFAQPQVEELLTKYRPDLLWFDEIDMKTDAQVENLYQSIRKLRPQCVINSRIQGCRFPATIPPPHCDYISTGDNEIAGKNLGFEWENPGSMNTSYGFNLNDHNWVSAKDVVLRLVEIVSKGGNYLLNVGPTPEGLIPQPCIDRLLEVGAWMDVNGEAIYGSSPWRVTHDSPSPTAATPAAPAPAAATPAIASGIAPAIASDTATAAAPAPEVRFTAKGSSVYAICLGWPDTQVRLKALGTDALPDQSVTAVSMLGSTETLRWQQTAGELTLSVPQRQPCQHAFVYRITLSPK